MGFEIQLVLPSKVYETKKVLQTHNCKIIHNLTKAIKIKKL